jgi:hypothetical protein
MAKPKKEKQGGKQRGKPAADVDLSTLRATLFGESPVSQERPARRRRLSPREQAEQLMDQALDEPMFAEELLRKAVEIDPGCAEAWSMLADAVQTPAESLHCSDMAIAAARRELGEDTFEHSAGHFWLDHDTRPYMTLLLDKAHHLLGLGRTADARAILEEMLRLNPNDNQGARELLAKCLLDLRDHAALDSLLAAYPTDLLLGICFSRALLAFRRGGEHPHANELLGAALRRNQHVAPFLLGIKPVPQRFPDRVLMGGEDEASIYAATFMLCWKESPGALSWLRGHADLPKAPPTKRSRRRSAESLRQLAALPQSEACWQVDVRSLDSNGAKRSASGWTWMVLDARGLPLSMDPLERFPGAREIWQRLESLMRSPQQGEPERPKRVQFCDERLLVRSESKLRKLDIDVELLDAFPLLDELFARYRQLPVDRPADAGTLQTEQLQQLPQHNEVWQADVRRAPLWVGGKHGPARPWIVLVTDRTQDLVLRHEILEDEPSGQQLAEQLRRAMAQPAAGPSRRPATVETSSAAAELRELVTALDIRLAVRDDLDHLDGALDSLAAHVNVRGDLPAMVGVDGMPIELVADFFAAAADYFRQQPWRKVPGDTIIEIECRERGGGPQYGVVMGQMGQTLGLATYDNLQELQSLMHRGQSDEEEVRTQSGLTMMFSEAFEIAVPDLMAAERYGWQVAGPEAYPLVVRLERGTFRPPQPAELEFLTACLRSLPEYLVHGRREWMRVPGSRRSLTLRYGRVQ